MRIISGKSKGKKIFDPKDINTRPLKDLTKESIFNIIIHSNKLNLELENSNVLDLFSGVGSFGLECLSRGSKNVTFVENYNNVLTSECCQKYEDYCVYRSVDGVWVHLHGPGSSLGSRMVKNLIPRLSYLW